MKFFRKTAPVKHFVLRIPTIIFALLLVYLYITMSGNTSYQEIGLTRGTSQIQRENPVVTVAVVVCKTSEIDRAMALLRSIVFFAGDVHINILCFTDLETRILFPEKVEQLIQAAMKLGIFVRYDIFKIWHPTGVPETNNLYTNVLEDKCAMQHLFYSTMLPTVDSLIYFELGTVLVSNVKLLWNIFAMMKPGQVFAVGESDKLSRADFKSGVVLLNLTRMRELENSNGRKENAAVSQMFRNVLIPTYPHLMEVIYNMNKEFRYEFPCEFNYQPSQCDCRGGKLCCNVNKSGVFVIYEPQRETPFTRGIFSFFGKSENLGENPKTFLSRIRNEGMDYPNDEPCSHLGLEIFRNVERYTLFPAEVPRPRFQIS